MCCLFMTDQVVFSFFIDSLLGVSFSAKVGERMSDGSFGYDLKIIAATIAGVFTSKPADLTPNGSPDRISFGNDLEG